MRFSKVLCAITIGLLSFTSNVDAKKIKTKRLQVVVNPLTASFAMNVGNGGFVTNIMATRPFGATYLLNGMLLPGGTVDKHAASYLLDKHGNPVTGDVIGTWWSSAQVLQPLNFTSFPTNIAPLLGQTVELITWSFLFDENCNGEANNFYSNGETFVETNALDVISFGEIMSLSVGTGCNVDPDGNNYTASTFFDANNVQLIEIEFDKHVEYEV